MDSLYRRSTDNRRSLLEDARTTNYGVVRLELIERLYERMYEQRRELGSDERKWPHRILGTTEVVGVDVTSDQLRLSIRPLSIAENTSNGSGQNGLGNGVAEDEVLEVDLIIAATGYQRQSHLSMIRDVAELLPEVSQTNGSQPKKEIRSKFSEAQIDNRVVRVSRDYSVQFASGKVSEGSGVWLQGCCEGTHGVSFVLVSCLFFKSPTNSLPLVKRYSVVSFGNTIWRNCQLNILQGVLGRRIGFRYLCCTTRYPGRYIFILLSLYGVLSVAVALYTR